jgi:hypothetical protein
MPRDRKAVEARKQRERAEQGENLSRYNKYGYNDPTAYKAIQNIMNEEKRKLQADRKGM